MEINQAFTILQNAGGIRAARIITDSKKKLSKINVLFMAWQLRRGVPVAKIIHEKWFYGLKFYTNKHTLDPRPDTETLVDAVISDNRIGKRIRILDLGAGTGCIIAAVCKHMPQFSGIGIDKSYGAVRVARKNIKNMGLGGRVKILWRSFDNASEFGEKFNIIVSNPPYIARNDMRVDNGAMHDPKRALYAKNDGLAAYQSIAQNAKNWIMTGGKIYLEIGMGQGDAVRDIFVRNGWKFIRAINDLAETQRVLVFQYK